MKKRSRRHSPEQIVKKLRDAEVMLNNGKSMEEVLKVLESQRKPLSIVGEISTEE